MWDRFCMLKYEFAKRIKLEIPQSLKLNKKAGERLEG